MLERVTLGVAGVVVVPVTLVPVSVPLVTLLATGLVQDIKLSAVRHNKIVRNNFDFFTFSLSVFI